MPENCPDVNGFLFEKLSRVGRLWITEGLLIPAGWRDLREIPGGDPWCGFLSVGALSADPPLSAMRIHARQIRSLNSHAGFCGYVCRPARQLGLHAAGMYTLAGRFVQKPASATTTRLQLIACGRQHNIDGSRR